MATPFDEFSLSAAAEEDGRLHITVRGELDLATAHELEDAVMDGIDAGGEVVVDLRELEFMDSTGVRVLVAAHTRASRGGARLIVVRPAGGSAVGRIIEVSGLDAELNLVEDPAEI